MNDIISMLNQFGFPVTVATVLILATLNLLYGVMKDNRNLYSLIDKMSCEIEANTRVMQEVKNLLEKVLNK